jgi:hypothetical protein
MSKARCASRESNIAELNGSGHGNAAVFHFSSKLIILQRDASDRLGESNDPAPRDISRLSQLCLAGVTAANRFDAAMATLL